MGIKYINIPLEEKEYDELNNKRKTLKLTWREFFVKLKEI